MPRIPLKERVLPRYSRGEERFNMISHIVGGALGIACLVLCIVRSAIHHNPGGIFGSLLFGISMILLYTMSAIYHGLHDGMGKRVLQVLDHCTIYLLIAGSYSAVILGAMVRLDPVTSWVLFGIIWVLAAIAITLNAIDLHHFRIFSMVCYLAMGWCAIVRLPLIIEACGTIGFALILAGGICYTIGAVLYGIGKKRKWMHSIFHLFVLAASILHTIAFAGFIL